MIVLEDSLAGEVKRDPGGTERPAEHRVAQHPVLRDAAHLLPAFAGNEDARRRPVVDGCDAVPGQPLAELDRVGGKVDVGAPVRGDGRDDPAAELALGVDERRDGTGPG